MPEDLRTQIPIEELPQEISEQRKKLEEANPVKLLQGIRDFISQDTDHDELAIRLEHVEEKLDLLNKKFDLIFGDNVLINGRFQSLTFKQKG